MSVDVAARSLFFPAAGPYIDRIGLAVDHHPSFEDFGEARCVDASCAACGEIVYEICRALGEVTPEVALPLYAAVADATVSTAGKSVPAIAREVQRILEKEGVLCPQRR